MSRSDSSRSESFSQEPTSESRLHRLPEMRETSRLGRLLRRFLLPVTVILLGLLTWVGLRTAERMDIAVPVPSMLGGPPEPSRAP